MLTKPFMLRWKCVNFNLEFTEVCSDFHEIPRASQAL